MLCVCNNICESVVAHFLFSCGHLGLCVPRSATTKIGFVSFTTMGFSTMAMPSFVTRWGVGPCQGIAGGAAFFWFVVFVISVISTCIPDWWWWMDSTSGVHEGLWSTCWAHYCVPANNYDSGCMSMLNVVRAFSVMTIIFSFFAFVASLMLICCIQRAFRPGMIFGILAVCGSLSASRSLWLT